MCGRQRVLDIGPTSIHQRTAIVCGGTKEMDYYDACVAEA
jgi:fructose-1,6-bisphosphatase